MKITLSYAQSIDGRIATANGESQWISGDATLHLAQKLRKDNDAILVGSGTVITDDPLLTCRIARNADPLRVIPDSSLRTPTNSQICRTAHQVPTVIYCSEKRLGSDPVLQKRKKVLEEAGIRVKGVTSNSSSPERPALKSVIEDLENSGVASLFVEGGAGIITAFLKEGLVDIALIVTAPIILGAGIEAVGDLGIRELSNALKPDRADLSELEGESLWRLEWDR